MVSNNLYLDTMSRKNTDTRSRILQSAWKLLESLENSVRMSDIAKAAGISRQALYLHFPTRAELLVATVRYLDEVKDVDDRLVASRAATTGEQRLDLFIEAWCNYIPEIYGVGRALMAMMDTDAEARAAWDDRMHAVRHGCAAVITALNSDGRLTMAQEKEATDLLWSLLSVPMWEHLTQTCGWGQEVYIVEMKRLARAALISR